MKPEETGSATGDLRYRTLKEMYRIVTEHGLKLETISSWALLTEFQKFAEKESHGSSEE